MGHKYLTTVALLSFASFAACSGDDSSKENPTEVSGTAGSAGRSGSGGNDRGGASTAGKGATVPTAGRSSQGGLAGRSSSSAGEPGAGGTAGISVPPVGRGGAGANVAGRGGAGAGTGGIAGSNAAPAGSNAQAGAGGNQAVSLSDAQIASVLLTADAGEVQQNMVALTRAVAPSARAFAQDLIDMHTAAQLRLNTLLTALNIVPQSSPVSDQLLKASDRIVAKLQNDSGVTFDMTYLQSQIDVHIQVLNLIDQTLLPNAKSEQLRNEIATVRAEVALHLARARTLAQALNLDVDAGVGGDIDAG